MPRRSHPVKERKLGRERALGIIDDDTGEIAIDPRQPPREWLATLIHEAIHAAFPDLEEKRVLAAEKKIAAILWRAGVRRIHQ